MDVTTEVLSGFFDDAWDAASQNANSLRGQLRANEKAINLQFATTGSLGAVAKNSASQSYRGPGLGSYTIPQIQTIWRTLIRLYDWFLQKANWLNQTNNPWFLSVWGPQGTVPINQQFTNDPDFAVYSFINCWLQNDFSEYQIDVTELRMRPTQLGINQGVLTW